MNTGQWIVIILSLFIGSWYAIGFYYNRNRSRAVAGWLYAGLEQYGEVKVSRLKGTSAWGGQFLVNAKEGPYRQLEVLFLLEPRENLPLWIFNRLQGKRDEIIMKAKLSPAPSIEIEAAIGKDTLFKDLMNGRQNRPSERMYLSSGYVMAQRGRKQPETMTQLRKLLEEHAGGLTRLSIQSKSPHLMISADLSALLSKPAEDFLGEIRDFVAILR